MYNKSIESCLRMTRQNGFIATAADARAELAAMQARIDAQRERIDELELQLEHAVEFSKNVHGVNVGLHEMTIKSWKEG